MCFSKIFFIVILQLFASVPLQSLNRLLCDDESTSGNHGMVLIIHLLREFQSFHKVFQLLVEKHDVISTGITCLEPVHARLKVKANIYMYLSFS